MTLNLEALILTLLSGSIGNLFIWDNLHRCAATPQFKKVLGEVKWTEKELAPNALKR